MFKQWSAVVCLALALGPLAAEASVVTYAGAGFRIPATGTAGLNSSSIAVGDLGTLSNVKVTLNSLTHTASGDLAISLTNGSLTVDLVRNLGVNAGLTMCIGAVGCLADYNGTYAFDDSYASTLWSASGNPVPSGNYRASSTEGAASSLSLFDASLMAGTWTLVIDDQVLGDVGQLGSWQLELSSADGSSVPEPGSMALVGLAFAALMTVRRRQT